MNSQSFLKELCELRGVDQPDVTTTDKEENRYVFEKSILFNNGDGTFSQVRIELIRGKGVEGRWVPSTFHARQFLSEYLVLLGNIA